ncbi:hypothetical protein D9611_011757 [Ephemerocybe angulata]|uniref:GTP cyclohydrolase N-terminal domain-containing protein n=1 Tax=Ephemerocybe angulata TaxID=980116 RepID=A0A8H5C691_9AGAR|nr:hypothetical protein D9611_011757 [Tulosesus angulatus]
MPVSDAVLTQILQQLEALQVSQQALQAKLDNLGATPLEPTSPKPLTTTALPTSPSSTPAPAALSTSPPSSAPVPARVALASLTDKEREKLLYPGRVNLTTYPDQHGIAPVPLTWGAASAADRGPVVCSRLPGSIKARNALGAHAGSYSIYRALSIAMGALDPTHKPDYSQTEPPVDIPPQPSWSDPTKIVSFDPWGHLVPQVFKEAMDGGVDVRPSIAVTKAHLKMSELDDAERRGELVVDGSIVLRSPVPGGWERGSHTGVEGKAAIDRSGPYVRCTSRPEGVFYRLRTGTLHDYDYFNTKSVGLTTTTTASHLHLACAEHKRNGTATLELAGRRVG